MFIQFALPLRTRGTCSLPLFTVPEALPDITKKQDTKKRELKVVNYRPPFVFTIFTFIIISVLVYCNYSYKIIELLTII